MKKLFLAVVWLALASLAHYTDAAVLYWDPEGASTATAANLAGTWDTTSSFWSTTSAQTTGPTTWVSTDAACFCAGSTTVSGAFTVSVNSSISCAGIFNGSLNPPGYNVTIGGTGTINFIAGTDALDTSGGDGDPLTITVPITGPGTAVIEGGNQLYLKVANTYTGGTEFGYLQNPFSSIVNFTNGSFGAGPILFSNANGSAMTVLGTVAVTIPNAVTNLQTNTAPVAINIVGNTAGVTFSGPWNFTGATGQPTTQFNLGSGGAVNTLIILSGIISGANGFVKYNPGMLELTGANTYGNAGTALGSTYVSNGWLVVANTSGSATGVSSVVTAPGTTAGTLTGNGTITGSITNYGNISATNMAGGCATLSTGPETWAPGSTNIWAINNVTGAAGASAGWNLIRVNGNLTISSTFTIAVTSLTAANQKGALATFVNTNNYSWLILTNTSGAIGGFNAANVTINTANFGNSLGSGKFTVSATSNALYLNFGQLPTVATGPAVFSVSSGGTAIINANTTGAQLTYAWQLNGGALTADASGQGTASLTISPAHDADAGSYTVQVSNPIGSVGSAPASLLVVVDPPVFAGSAGAGNFTMNFSGPVGKNYRIWSTNVLGTNSVYTWTPVSFGLQFGSGVNTFTDMSATTPDNYYCITVP